MVKTSARSFLLLLLFSSRCIAQGSGTKAAPPAGSGSPGAPNGNAVASEPVQPQTPAPKYLIEMYSVNIPSQDKSMPTPPAPRKTPQQITIATKIPSTVLSGHPIDITAVSDSKLLVTLKIQSGQATITGSTVTPTDAGSLVLVASQAGNDTYSPAQDVSIKLDVQPDDGSCVPGLMPAPPPPKVPESPTKTDLIIQYLGNPSPFSFVKVAEGEIAIYSSQPPAADDKGELTAIEKTIVRLAGIQNLPALPSANGGTAASSGGQTPPAYNIEVSVPHAAALGDLATRFSGFNPNTFTIQDVGSDRIRITSQTMPSCHDVTQLLSDIRRSAWKPVPQSPVSQLFHLQASDVTGPFGASSGGSGGGAGQVNNGGGGQGSGTGNGQGGGAGGQGNGSGSGQSTSVQGSQSNNTGGQSPNGNQGNPAGTGQSSTSAQGNAGNSGTASGTGGQSGGQNGQGAIQGNGGTSAQGGGGNTTAAKPPALAGVDSDLLYFTDANPGDDAGITELKRALAILDLPRPEVIISAWSMQASSSDPDVVGKFRDNLSRVVELYNSGIQSAINTAWGYLAQRMASAEAPYFDSQFYNYITQRYVADQSAAPSASAPDAAAQAFLNYGQQTGGPRAQMGPDDRSRFGFCPANRYCLGYASLFAPLRPRLTDMFVAVMAAKDPHEVMSSAITQMECNSERDCRKQAQNAPAPCESVDLENEQAQVDKVRLPPLFLECLRQITDGILSPSEGQVSRGTRLTRMAIADFLFNYKMSQEFPHDFAPYELSQSAQTLNSAFDPFADAFNRDIAVYQQFLYEQFQSGEDRPHSKLVDEMLGSDKPTFINEGSISVRTLSSKEATVSAATQNFLDATQQPTVSALLSSIEKSTAPAASKTGQMSDLLQNITPIQAQVLQGVLNSVQTTKIQIGRTLSIDVTPRSQPGASSAELTVSMKADESAAPTYFVPLGSTSTASGNADVSRVAQHDISTNVRVESVKLFEISAFTADLQRSRSRFPLLPPFVEMPYFGTLIGIPLGHAKEYHSSTAIMSAIVVPTAADLANGLAFTQDRVVNPATSGTCAWSRSAEQSQNQSLCSLRTARTMQDLESGVRTYHKMMMSCLATGHALPTVPGSSCMDLTFDSFPRDGQ